MNDNIIHIHPATFSILLIISFFLGMLTYSLMLPDNQPAETSEESTDTIPISATTNLNPQAFCIESHHTDQSLVQNYLSDIQEYLDGTNPAILPHEVTFEGDYLYIVSVDIPNLTPEQTQALNAQCLSIQLAISTEKSKIKDDNILTTKITTSLPEYKRPGTESSILTNHYPSSITSLFSTQNDLAELYLDDPFCITAMNIEGGLETDREFSQHQAH